MTLLVPFSPLPLLFISVSLSFFSHLSFRFYIHFITIYPLPFCEIISRLLNHRARTL